MNIISSIITISLAIFGWRELDKAADEKNWLRFMLGLILLVLAVLRENNINL